MCFYFFRFLISDNHSTDSDAPMKLPPSSPAEGGGRIEDSHRGSHGTQRMDPPDDEPPSLKKDLMDELNSSPAHYPDPDTPAVNSNVDTQGLFIVKQTLGVDTHDHMMGQFAFPNQYVSPDSESLMQEQYFQEPPSPIQDQYYQETSLHYYEADGIARQNDAYYGEDPEGSHNEYGEQEGSPANGQYYEEGQSPVHDGYYEGEPPTPFNGPNHQEEPSPNIDLYYADTPTHYEDAHYFHENGELQPVGHDEDVAAFASSYANSPLKTSCDDEYNGTDEKKFGLDKEDRDAHSHLDNSAAFISVDGQPERFIDTSSNPYSPTGKSARSVESGEVDSSKSHQSPAMRGAHEILRKNRRRRLET
jgi:hypothetical protein